MITKRDQDIINFLDDFHAATSGQLRRLFFDKTSYQYSSKRLKDLTDMGHIKRLANTMSNGYAYYAEKRPLQLHHDLIRTELYTAIKAEYKLLEWNNEVPVENIRPDALCYIEYGGTAQTVFVEIHLNNKFDFNKYRDLVKNCDLRVLFGLMPRVIICTDRQITTPAIGIKFKVVGVDMQGIENIFK